jgi:hypothetical protein
VPGRLENGHADDQNRIEVLYCRLRLGKKQCPKGWTKQDFDAFAGSWKGEAKQSVSGCFQIKKSAVEDGNSTQLFDDVEDL